MKRPITTLSVAVSLVLGAAIAGLTLAGGANAAPGCGLPDAAFCETFDTPKPDSTTRTGDLDETYWGVSRIHRPEGSGDVSSPTPTATLDGVSVRPPNDVRISGGLLHEAQNDGDGESVLAMYPKQPWDIAGRTGTATFQVGNDAQNEHAAWPEFWWTDQPVPAPTGTQEFSHPGIESLARNSVGVKFAAQCTSPNTPGNVFDSSPYVGVSSIETTSNYGPATYPPMTNVACVRKGSHSQLNTYQIRASISRLEVWGSDPGGPLKLLAYSNATLPMTRGVIWVNDVHYNANKFGSQKDHEFVWDNVGFDGPTPYRDLTYDVKDKSPTSLGYPVTSTPTTFTVNGVAPTLTPTAAFVNFNWFAFNRSVPQVSVNGGPFTTMAYPWSGDFVFRTIAVPVTGWVNGTNTIAIKSSPSTSVSNINLVLIAAAPVSGAPPTTTTSTVAPTTTATSTTTVPSSTSTSPTTTTVPAPVHYPAGYTGDIFVGSQQIWPTSTTTTSTVAPTTTTVAPTTSTTTVAPTTTTAEPAHFGMLAVGAALPSDAECAAQVRPAAEIRPDNVTANHTLSDGTGSKPSARYDRVTGNFQGTTEEILQWGACKWGIDEDYVKAQAVVESYWHQNTVGDNGESHGLLQVREPYWGWAFPGAQVSSAYNVDAALAARRACFEGDETWLNQFNPPRPYAAGDIVGCMGLWFSGRWYDAGATQYISTWQGHLNARTWETPGFLNG